MSKKMLIDATHPEETRVAMIDQSQTIIDFDFNSSLKKTIKGNIYLAKIARVEPSLQAAFVEYGGMRHGFLAFNEIHPDYFRIPVSDREQLQQEILNLSESPDTLEEEGENLGVEEEDLGVEKAGSFEDTGKRRFASLHRRYKIQEVLQKGQIVLVQVAKEERGGKGAALTTFLSLPGRYCVLMPNSPKSGGISRKISSQSDRSRLKKSLGALNLPHGMGLIVRTAGKDRTRSEIKRDAEYLMRLWNEIRETTLASVAPSLIYQEDDIIKRAIRDMYSKDVEEIWVEGEEGYKIAKTFMKTLLPSHGKKVKQYKDAKFSLFHQHGLETQIESMHHARVSLPSGGSLVIHPTEALVSIDVNSGKSTRERHIEETALKTNLEAATEAARQLRLRDLAGLVVIDFIDMDEPRNIAAVERRIKESFKNDRARIQMGRISSFGLLELSRQRLSPSILEISSHPCSYCAGTGYIRSIESLTVHILRMIEQECLKNTVQQITVKMSPQVAFYIFNHKRDTLLSIETRQSIRIYIEPDASLGPDTFLIQPLLSVKSDEKTKALSSTRKEAKDVTVIDPSLDTSPSGSESHPGTEEGQEKRGRRNRRRSRKRGRDVTGAGNEPMSPQLSPAPSLPDASTAALSCKELETVEATDLPSYHNSDTNTEDTEKTLSASARRRRRRRTAAREAKLAPVTSTGEDLGASNLAPLEPASQSELTSLSTAKSTPVSKMPKEIRRRGTKKPKPLSKGEEKVELEGNPSTVDQKFSLSPMEVLTLAPSLHPTTPGDVQPANVAKKTNKTWWRRILNSPSSGTKT